MMVRDAKMRPGPLRSPAPDIRAQRRRLPPQMKLPEQAGLHTPFLGSGKQVEKHFYRVKITLLAQIMPQKRCKNRMIVQRFVCHACLRGHPVPYRGLRGHERACFGRVITKHVPPV